MLAIKSLKTIGSSNLFFLFPFSVWVATKKIEKHCSNHSCLQKKSFCAVCSFVRGTLKLTDIIELSQLKTNSILIIVTITKQ